MNVQHLIHSVVQQTTVLIAQLATAGGVRAPLADIANQVFADLAAELEDQGLSRKVTADMFGISLRSYQRKVARLKESSSVQGKTLWEAVLEEVTSRGGVTRRELLTRFERDDEEVVRGILRDLVESGLVKGEGSGAEAVYRPSNDEELRLARKQGAAEGLPEFVWAVLFRYQPVTRARLKEVTQLSSAQLEAAIDTLLLNKRIEFRTDAGKVSFVSRCLLVEQGAMAGWEASVYDHFQAVVSTIIARLNRGAESEDEAQRVGGSTYGFDVSPEHPLRSEALSLLAEFREKASDLRMRVTEYNDKHGTPGNREEVLVYAGQRVTRSELE